MQGALSLSTSRLPSKIFTEGLPRVAPPYSGHTTRLTEIVELVGYSAGGLPGQRLLERLAICVSGDGVDWVWGPVGAAQ